MGISLFKILRRLAYLIVISVFAFIELGRAGNVRRTFEFFTYTTGQPAVEDRMLLKAASEETNLRYYLEEVLLGPVSVDFAPLVTKGTRLRSLMLRDGTVYADLSGEAALPVGRDREVFDALLALNRGIRRNFLSISDVKLFINGNEVFFEEFREIFG
ncbi:MAG: GerMN domain-containing protein [Treponema sp.]|jgi:hypothetical protein|nr:GerMN domain-containing protein [Treponema sp.]